MEPINCSKIKTIPQFGSTCWFNVILMALFYSQYIRKLILSKNIEQNIPMKTIIVNMLNNLYTDNTKFYEKFTPEVILGGLNKENPNVFNITSSSEGYFADRYIHKMLDYIGVTDYVYLDAVLNDATTNEYSLYLKPSIIEEDEITENIVTEYFNKQPDILMINTKSSLNPEDEEYPDYFKKENFTFNESIRYNGNNYIVDSMILDNFNDRVCKKGHSICGITCNGQRYLYNGWTKKTFDKSIDGKMKLSDIPCELMQHDWLDTSKEQFCLDLNACDIKYHETKQDKIIAVTNKDICFSFKKGSRIYIYIREDLVKPILSGGKYKYNKRMYKIHTGPRGGKFIIVKGEKVRIKL